MNQPYKLLYRFVVCLLAASLSFTACNKDDDATSGNQTQLLSFGPSPILRGAELKIIGTRLDRVTAVILPEGVSISSFNSQSEELITLTVPEQAVSGKIMLKTPDGDIVSVSNLGISEPIELLSFSPSTARPGDLLSIEGEYLNLIKEVIFHNAYAVGDTAFVSQSREKIEMLVPDGAQTGLIALSDGKLVPFIVESEEELTVTVPQALTFSPNPVKAGAVLTIEGTDLDLVRQVGFEGVNPVAGFLSQSATKIEVTVPEEANDGFVQMIPGSFVEVPSAVSLTMLLPQITSLAPNPVKNGQNVVVTGQNLDLINKVIFGGGKIGAVLGGATATQMTVKVPATASEDVVMFQTKADKSALSPSILELVEPTATSINPAEAPIGSVISIEGNDLDVVASVVFPGGTVVAVNNATVSTVTVTVPTLVGNGLIRLVMKNGQEVGTDAPFVLDIASNALVTGMPAQANLGSMMSITGTGLSDLTQLFFPGDVPATTFGQKTDTLIEVFVPTGTIVGIGHVRFVTAGGEVFLSQAVDFQ